MSSSMAISIETAVAFRLQQKTIPKTQPQRYAYSTKHSLVRAAVEAPSVCTQKISNRRRCFSFLDTKIIQPRQSNDAQLILKSPQWRTGVGCPVTPSRACQAILEEHTDDRHHGKSAICYLSCELLVFLLWIRTRENLPTKVTWSVRAVVHARDFAEGTISDNLCPAWCGHLRDGSQAVWNVFECQPLGGAQGTREFANDLGRDVSHGGQHADAAMLDLRLPASGEILRITIRSKAGRVPETHGCLNAQLILKSPQWRTGVGHLCPAFYCCLPGSLSSAKQHTSSSYRRRCCCCNH